MLLKYRGTTYTPSASEVTSLTETQIGVYRGVMFRSQRAHTQPQRLGVTMTYRGQEYLG
jgi:hypothetical protein